MDLELLSIGTFKPLVGTVFSVKSGDSHVELKLVEVEDLSRLRESATLPDGSNLYQRDPFTLVFVGPKEPVLEGAIHRLSHPQLGTLEFSLKPYFQSGDATFYDSVFN